MIAACGVALLTAMVALLLRECGFRGAPVVVAVGTCALLSLCAEPLGEAMPLLSALSDVEGLQSHAAAVMRIVGIGWLCGLTADLCRELEATGVARAVTVVGRLCMLGVALPFVTELLQLALAALGE